ncbi:metallophosphoesterase [Paradesulfitobacterium aromaticivorans]
MKTSRIKRPTIILLATILGLFGFIYFSNNTLQISKYTVDSMKLPTDINYYKILQLSDLHSKQFGQGNRRLLQKIDDEKPDIIVMTGDMINTSDDNFDTFLKLAQNLAQKYKVYFIVGNHEQIINNYRLSESLKNYGVTVLDNERVKLERGKSFINLYGMSFSLKYYKDKNNPYTKDIEYDLETMQKALGRSHASEYNVLLTHNPMYFPTYAQWGADLTLSGHVHGRVINIPFKGGLLSPERVIFPEYYAGSYLIENKEMIVNWGLGNGNVGIRVFNRPEISVITLSNEANSSP